ncbi:sulfotransferase domain-containing protein [Ruegeria sp. A3M17]|uniref:sulfotransferase domain-containing protein n=1 Tax=Ruegeria sp. A3M17 TaxID=2267229 RepID=UPI001F244ECF|nr:sulfotransferase domain-containing protein [Ruegeria sp. A3M17]
METAFRTRRGPDFLCIGMPKCGTSTLQVLLRDRTVIYVSPLKEIKFFARDRIGYDGGLRNFLFSKHWAARQERRAVAQIAKQVATGKEDMKRLNWALSFVTARRDLDWYLDLFPRNRISGDISPCYHMLNDDEVQHVKSQLPHLKIVILLRNPFDQLWSHCRMSTRAVKIEDEVAFYREKIDYQMDICPRYVDLVERWQKVYGPKNVIVDYLESLSSNPGEVLNRIVSFIDPPMGAVNRIAALDATPKVFKGKKMSMPDETCELLRDAALQRLEGFERINEGLARHWRSEVGQRCSVGSRLTNL